MSRYKFIIAVVALAGVLLYANQAFADPIVPAVTINTSSSGEITNSEVYTGLKLAFLVSSMAFLPSLIMTMTSFTRIAIVLSMTRQALGTGQTPPNQVLLGLALFLTFGIMGPIFQEIYTKAVVPYSEDQISNEEALTKGFAPLKTFMLNHTRDQDLALFLEISRAEPPESPQQLGATVVVPAFVISELNTAFQIAFLIYLPFLILDMIISSVLTSMSMITLPPTVISLPIKLMLFVVVDGWHLIIGNLVKSYHV